jgi:methionyl aminopeptidase
MARIKTSEDIERLRVGGKHHAAVIRALIEAVQPGVTTRDLNVLAEKMIREFGDTPSFLGYTPRGTDRPFPGAICTSVNDVIVHGMPDEPNIALKEGDIIGLDVGVTHESLITDAAVTVAVGNVEPDVQKLIEVTKNALQAGIKAARAGNRVGDIGAAIQAVVAPHGFGIVRELGGHGVGHKVHEDPMILNFGKAGTGEKLVPGMVLAIEPMLNEGSADVVFEDDSYTVRTRDGSLSAHFEHTILITEGDAEVLTA